MGLPRERLEHLSSIDALTGIVNRRGFDEALRREWARAQRHGEDLTLLMIDIDHFKQLNDSYGHPAGDARLCAVSGTLAGCARRGTDIVARYGGEEFAAILPGLDRDAALLVAEAMREAVEARALPSPVRGGVVTVSIGVAQASQAGEDMIDALLHRADHALYEAKRSGRNRVCVGQAMVVPIHGYIADDHVFQL